VTGEAPHAARGRPDFIVSAGLAVLVLGPFGLGYFMSYLYRAVNAVVGPDLVRDIGLSASQLGLLTASYLIAFAGFQLPLGVLLDRFGPRRVQTALIALTGLGALIFSLSHGLIGLSAGRALIGMGCAGGLMGSFKAVTLWVRPERRALANACVMAVGGLGILTATVPAEFAAREFGWRGLFLGLVILSLLAAALIFFAVPERGVAKATPMSAQIGAVARIYADPVFWRLAPFVASTAGVGIGIQTLWAGPWLRDVAGLDRTTVAEYLAMMAIAFLVGTLLSGAVADWLGRRGIGLLKVMTGFTLVYMGAELLIVVQWLPSVALVWIVFGMVGQAGILAYPWLAVYVGADLAGRANTALNLLVFTTASLSQYLIGWIIDWWPLTAAGGYDPTAYKVSFGVFLALQAACLAWYLLKPPTVGRRREG
jgi:MFS family permease